MNVILILQAFLIGFGAVYFLATGIPGLWQIRHGRQGKTVAGHQYEVYVMLPCLNEELVIGETVGRLVAQPGLRVIVIDDGSEDRTGSVARAVDPERVLVARRVLPQARQGKGPALNTGYALLEREIERRGVDPARVLVCVMDADGHLSSGALDHVRPLFDDPRVGGVQLAVRIRNRGKLLTLIQDLEFWGPGAVSQYGRLAWRTVSLGGNGQFTRLTALRQLQRPPWSDSLTEDLDLALALVAHGWQLKTTPDAYVDQQGVESLGRLLRQRTRWFQGHMQCGQWLPTLWRSRRTPHAATIEVTLYLLVPWVLVLPWSIVFHVGLGVLVADMANGHVVISPTTALIVVNVVAWYLLSFAPQLLAGYMYFRQDPARGRLRCLLLGHLLVPASYIAYAACWRALFRIMRGHRGWTKTARVRETTQVTS